MIRRARSQAADISSDIPVRVPSLTLKGSAESVAGRRAVLEINGGG